MTPMRLQTPQIPSQVDEWFALPEPTPARSCSAELIHLGRIESEEPWQYARHTHHDYELIRVRSGRIHVWIDDQPFVASPETCYLVTPGQSHREACREGGLAFDFLKFYVLDRSGETRLAGSFAPLERSFLAPVDPKILWIWQEVWQETTQPGPWSACIVEALLLQLLGLLGRLLGPADRPKPALPRSKPDCVLAAAQAYLRANLDRRVGLDELAAACRVSRDYLGHLCKAHLGESPLRLAMRLRLERAKALLLEQGLSLEETAAQTGFSDVYHFAKAFRKFEGQPPGRFRACRGTTRAAPPRARG